MARELRLFYLFRLLSTSYLFVPISVWFASTRGLSMVDVMTLSALYALVVIVMEVPTGAIADRLGRRATMAAGALSMAAACVTWVLSEGMVGFAVAEGLAALSMTLCSGADSAYLFDLLNDHGRGDEYPHREGIASAWHQAGQALAFAAGGFLFLQRPELPYLVTAAVSSVAFFVALFMREERVGAPRASLSPAVYARDVGATLRSLPLRRRLLWVVFYSALLFTLLRATVYVYQPFLADAGFGPGATGLVFAAIYLVAAFVSRHFDALRRRVTEPTLVWGLLGALAVTFLALGHLTGPVALVVMVVQAAANGIYSPLTKLLLNREIRDSARRATLLSFESMVRRAVFGLASPLLGWLVVSRGSSAALLVCGMIGIAGWAALAGVWRARAGARSPSPARLPSDA